MNGKIILFELNEVPLQVIDTYIKDHPNSAFSKLMSNASVTQTVTVDTKWLHPWCTWPTLHRGVETDKHMLTNLSQSLTEVDNEFPPIWKILAEQNVSVGIAGSLHSWPLPNDLTNYDFYLPDTFAYDAQAFPVELEKFQDFNLSMVDKSARNVSTGIAGKKALALMPHLLKLGFTAKTATKVVNQLINEKRISERKGRRRILQGVIAFDAFFSQLQRKKPHFSTFFTNHVASSMHRYWAATFPNEFQKNEFDATWINTFSKEIDYAMQEADEMLQKLLKFVDENPEFSILMTTSMGQAAFSGQKVNRQVYVKDPNTFLGLFGLEPFEWDRMRVMLPIFAVTVDGSKNELLKKLSENINISGEKIKYEFRGHNYHMFHFGVENLEDENCFIEINNSRYSFEEAGLENTIIEDNAGSTGYHIPEGMMFVYNPLENKKTSINDFVDTRFIAPAILKHFELDVPSYMQKDSFSLM